MKTSWVLIPGVWIFKKSGYFSTLNSQWHLESHSEGSGVVTFLFQRLSWRHMGQILPATGFPAASLCFVNTQTVFTQDLSIYQPLICFLDLSFQINSNAFRMHFFFFFLFHSDSLLLLVISGDLTFIMKVGKTRFPGRFLKECKQMIVQCDQNKKFSYEMNLTFYSRSLPDYWFILKFVLFLCIFASLAKKTKQKNNRVILWP